MIKIKTYLFILAAITVWKPFDLFAQNPDSLDFYDKIHQRAQKHKVTQWIYDGIFRRPNRNDNKPVVKQVKKVNVFLPYKGKIIRNVRIVSLDPFGYSVNDTLRDSPNNLEKLGNRYHVNTRERIIRHILLFKTDEEVDPLELSESERLLRLYPYVNDARIYLSTVKSGRRDEDSVDVTVVVQDRWATIIGSGLDVNNPDLRIVEKNVFGLGHQLEEGVTWHNPDKELSTFGKYTIANVGNTFINTSFAYATARENNQLGVALDRPFYSPLAKWAGGASVTRNYTLLEVVEDTSEGINSISTYPVNFNTQDVWIAKSFPVTGKKSASINQRSKNYIAGVRYYHRAYFERPSFDVDTNRLNRDETMYLANFGFTQRKYYKDRYLFRFGANEDIPEGYSVELVQGTRDKEYSRLEYYSGIKLAAGKHIKDIGYLSGGLSYGTFYNKGYMGTGVMNVDAYYFSDLIIAGKWFFREFSRFQYTQGFNRDVYESVNINGSQMYGFSSDVLTAKSKMMLNLEFVMYAPYEVIGFKFAPVLLVGLARVGNNIGDMAGSYTYQSYALGLLIRNEHLIVNTFEVSIGLYPFIPGLGDNVIKMNPMGSHNVKTKDFNVGKADLVPYQ